MKKLLIIICIMFGTLTYAQTDSISNIDITQAERIVDKYTGQIADTFNKGLEKITPVAEQGFEIAVKLQLAKGIAYLLLFPLMIISWLIFMKYYKKAIYEQTRDDWIEENYGGIGLSFLVLSIILSVVNLFTLYTGITHVIAPEWFAIKEIIEMFN